MEIVKSIYQGCWRINMALTDEQKKWVNANYKGVGTKELTRQLNKKFGTSVGV